MIDWGVRCACRALWAGGVIAYPTEAVFGLGCDPLDAAAVARVLRLKRRSIHKGLILIAATFEQLRPYLDIADPVMLERILSRWPGPTTWLVPARRATPRWLTGRHRSLAVRVTAHPTSAALCERFGGAVVSTSANVSRTPPARSALAARRRFPGALDYVLPGEIGGAERPTEIRDALTDRVVRVG